MARRSTVDIDILKGWVPPPADYGEWVKTVQGRWNPAGVCPDMKDWLLHKKAANTSERLKMLGNMARGRSRNKQLVTK